MALFNSRITVIRRENQEIQITIINSEDLVPGDLIILNDQMRITCDCLLISGICMMNECSLTGETIPIRKIVPENQIQQNNIIFEGTELI